MIPNLNIDQFTWDYFEHGEGVLVTECLEGEEIDSMVLGCDGEALLITHKTREKELAGNIIRGTMVERPELDVKIKQILKKIPLKYNASIQFKGGKLIEINPRSSTYVYSEQFCEPWLAVGLAAGLFTQEYVKEFQQKIPYYRKFIRETRMRFYE